MVVAAGRVRSFVLSFVQAIRGEEQRSAAVCSLRRRRRRRRRRRLRRLLNRRLFPTSLEGG